MRMPWFRLYHEARNDRKLDTLADDEFRVWHKLLCFASEQDERGVIVADDRYLLAIEVARGDEELLSRVVTRLIALKIICDDGHAITFLNFIKRNYDKPSDAPEATRLRKQKSRTTSRKKAEPAESVTRSHAQEEKREEKRREEERTHPPLPPAPQGRPLAPPAGGVAVRATPKPATLNRDQQRRFDRWYPTYPNKQHRPEAEKAFARLDPDDPLTDTLVADTARRQTGRKWAEGFIELPATYLHKRVWEDDIEPVRLVQPTRAGPHGYQPALTRSEQRAANINRGIPS